ncbi:MAG: DNA primase [Rhodospirillaceae bacterium]|jgi:DNA primase|nr:DNA primase [Rhodospirillaceae bacterium]MBT6137816.1 DNA primase [Rhodospirillaceae bacterium]
MSFPNDFLEELRARVPVSEVIGRRVRLQRKGREFLGLCPFHSDRKPSMSVVDEKGFYHCFACGAHGDIITFVRETEGLEFVEAIEKLAGMAGMEVPRQTPEAQRQEVRRKTISDAIEAACLWYERNLHEPGGAEALAYLKGRGLSDHTITTFRLGFAPAERGALRKAMVVKGVEPDLLVEAGLIKQAEDRDETYDYFRGRVMFPITDRRGRVIAFGGRIMGDGQPKYLNSPDNPVFHKGQVLYGLAQAREPARKVGSVVVVEGYMDVIALAQAGIGHAVAPLGTALTPDQIVELWRLAAEPVLCFDGDVAGQNAAARAAERVLPVLKPGHSLRFAKLPAGQDPDDLITQGGTKGMQEVLDGARPLAEVLWEDERARGGSGTPEQRADFHRRIRDRVRQISDRAVQEAYTDYIESRIRDERRDQRGESFGARGGGRMRQIGGKWRPAPVAPRGARAARSEATRALGRRQQQVLLATLVRHPALIEEVGEPLGMLAFDDPFLDKLRQQIIEIAWAEPALDSDGLVRNLGQVGLTETCDGLLAAETLEHAAFARSGTGLAQAREGLLELMSRIGKPQLEAQLVEAQRAVAEDLNEANWNRVLSLRSALEAINQGPQFTEAR